MTTEETPSNNRPEISDNEIIERFGGIRPMAAKLGVAVTTVQGWKEREHIPANRWQQIVESAAKHGIDLGAGSAAPAVPASPAAEPDEDQIAQSRPASSPQERVDTGPASHSRPKTTESEVADESSVEAPASQASTPTVRQSKDDGRRWISPPGVAWIALLLTFVLGAALLTRPYWESALHRSGSAGSGGADSSWAGRVETVLDAMQQTVSRLDRDFDDRSTNLEGRITALEAGGGEAGTAFADQLADLDAQLTSLSESIETLSRNTGEATRRLAMLESMQDQLPEPVQRELAKITARLDRLQSGLEQQGTDMKIGLDGIDKSIGVLDSRVTELETRPIQTGEKIAALALAIGQLEAAVDSGNPYRPALDRLQALGRDDPLISDSRALNVLAPWADHGIPDRLALYRRYVEIAPEITRALAATDEETWLDSVWNSLKGLVTIRRIGSGGELSPVSQAEIAMDRGDLSAAAAALEAGGSPGPEGEAWLALVKARIEAEREIESLYGQVIAPLAGSADAGAVTQ